MHVDEIPEFQLPESYSLHAPIFKASMVKIFAVSTLFHMFYTLPRE